MRVLPGKMAEAMELLEKHVAIARRYGFPPTMRSYRPIIGGGDSMHTIVFEIEGDGLTNPEIQALMQKWEVVEESHEVELYMTMP